MRFWSIIHFGLALALPIGLVFLLSCKQAHEEKAGLGTPFDPSQLDAAFAEAIDGASLANLQVGQKVNYQINLRVENQDPSINMGSHLATVVDRSIDASTQETRITVHHSQEVREQSGTFQDVESESTFEVPQSSPALIRKMAEGVVSAFSAARDTTPLRTTYYDLSVSQGTIDPPDAPKGRPDCGGISPCHLHVTYISYTTADWYSDTDYDKKIYDFAFTNQLPYMDNLLGIMVEGCLGEYQTLNNIRVFARQCTYLSDYQK